MLISIIWRGFKKQLANYLIFFFSLIFAVMVYYSFTAMTYEQPLIRSAGKNTQLVGMLGFGSFAVVLILLFFMANTNRFFIENRRKDISIFHLYGLNYYQICLWFISEIFFIGIFSFGIGIGLGILLSKLFSMILVKAMDLSLQVHFFFSPDAIITTGLVVLFILAVVSFQILWLVSGYKFSHLKKQRLRKVQAMKISLWQKILGIFGALFLLSGWTMAAAYTFFVRQASDLFGLIQGTLLLMSVIFGLCVIGSYLFFAFTLRWYNSYRPKRLNKNLGMLSRSEWQLRLFSEWRFFGSITVALGLALAILGGMVALVSLEMRAVDEIAPASLMLTRESYEKFAPKLQSTLPYQRQTLHFKAVPAKQNVEIRGEGVNSGPEVMDMITVSDYRAFQKINPTLQDIQLNSDHSTVVLSSYQRYLNDYTRYSETINLKEQNITVQAIHPNFFGDMNLRYGTGLIVVSDELFNKTAGLTYTTEVIDVDPQFENKLNQLIRENLEGDWDHPIHYNLAWKNQQIIGEIAEGKGEKTDSTIYRSEYTSHQETYRTTRSSVGLVLFVVTFVTTTFIITTASMVTLRQLSEFKQKKKQYGLLRQMGIPDKAIYQEIKRENRVVFFIPAILALIHSMLALSVIAHIAKNANYGFVYLFCGLMLVVYVLFYWAACAYQKKIV
ncbi:ABC transporter permease [Enterococcus xiangfangensis]|uniref:FtsX-like permease family protein n=1 Tax=Enterococcus xiangfangensis TaxID=1296537 RepID=A0ABU3F909_9ENTE|nr:FtsX-like permease family protein [Enterococcus xiangfangensis]MDT2758527.1 FtsX-like permease family protein [Enterococcus xiangfangensis]